MVEADKVIETLLKASGITVIVGKSFAIYFIAI
jgi:hypothetical protein